MFLTYNCNVCGKPGVVEYEHELEASVAWVEKILTHNRCGDFMADKLKQVRRIQSALEWHERRKLIKTENEAEIRARALNVIIEATKVFCFTVCRHYGKPFAWEPFFAEEILNNPMKFRAILNSFENVVQRNKTL